MAESNLTDTEKEVIALMEVLVRTDNANRDQIKKLFDLHNQIFKPRETGMHCSGCRSRVFNKMKEYYNNLVNEKI